MFFSLSQFFCFVAFPSYLYGEKNDGEKKNDAFFLYVSVSAIILCVTVQSHRIDCVPIVRRKYTNKTESSTFEETILALWRTQITCNTIARDKVKTSMYEWCMFIKYFFAHHVY